MAIIGSTIDAISSKKIKPATSSLKIENIPAIKNVKSTKIIANFAGGSKVPGITVSYEYTSTYYSNEDKIAEIKIEGKLLYTTKDEKEAKELEKEFEKTKRMKSEVEIEILNHILHKATLHALTLSQMLELPPVIRMPRIVRREKA
ncbi:MAG: hypothetical protein GXN99_01870 [Candidatus Nanohaloarchaeota archaeon]|nr:hypothetical protein [Candidatus Nanohaloarchaeota archaeon]